MARFVEKLRKYHLEFRHVLLLFVILAAALLLLSLLQRDSMQSFLLKTQDAYQSDSAERLASLTTIALETVLETAVRIEARSAKERRKVIEDFNILFSQQLLLEHVEEVSLLITKEQDVFAIDNGQVVYDYFFGDIERIPPPDSDHAEGVELYRRMRHQLMLSEEILSVVSETQTFHVLVPFVPNGEYAGAVYMKSSPDFTYITNEIVAGYTKFTIMFIGLILLGLVSMFYISSYSLRQRDRANELLYKAREKQLEERIHYQKEALFTKRIYHTHHKAEKVMGFIKEDLRSLSDGKIEDIKYRVTKYANFVARVIYDMKWFEPPLQTIRNPIFKTDLNEVIRFIVEHICRRVTENAGSYQFKLDLDDRVPQVHVNEFVVWEILEPMLQNSLDHNDEGVVVEIKTRFDTKDRTSVLAISDNGVGIPEDLLQIGEHGVRKIFMENISTKDLANNSGYGCYLAHEIATKRCRWAMDVQNLPQGGCEFTIVIPHAAKERTDAQG